MTIKELEEKVGIGSKYMINGMPYHYPPITELELARNPHGWDWAKQGSQDELNNQSEKDIKQ